MNSWHKNFLFKLIAVTDRRDTTFLNIIKNIFINQYCTVGINLNIWI